MLTVMSFNLRLDTPKDSENQWPYRKEAAVETIHKYAPDILGIQEGLPQQVAYLDAALSVYARVGRGRDVDGGEHAAIYLRKETLTIIDTGDFWLSDTPDIPGSKHWGNNCVRMATWAVLEMNGPGTRFLTLNTHLDHESENARKKGALVVHEFLADKSLPAVVTGDMNAVPGSLPIRFFTGEAEIDGISGHLVNTQAASGNLEAGGTFHNYGRLEPITIDYILTTPEFRTRGFQVVQDRPDGRFISDHYPIVAQLELA